jgi:hypothetical protein
MLQDLVGKSVQRRFGISGVEFSITRLCRSSSSRWRRYSAHCHAGLGAVKNL